MRPVLAPTASCVILPTHARTERSYHPDAPLTQRRGTVGSCTPRSRARTRSTAACTADREHHPHAVRLGPTQDWPVGHLHPSSHNCGKSNPRRTVGCRNARKRACSTTTVNRVVCDGRSRVRCCLVLRNCQSYARYGPGVIECYTHCVVGLASLYSGRPPAVSRCRDAPQRSFPSLLSSQGARSSGGLLIVLPDRAQSPSVLGQIRWAYWTAGQCTGRTTARWIRRLTGRYRSLWFGPAANHDASEYGFSDRVVFCPARLPHRGGVLLRWWCLSTIFRRAVLAYRPGAVT